MPLLLHPRTPLLFFVTAAACCLVIMSLRPIGTPRSLSPQLLHNGVAFPACATILDSFLGREALHLLNFIRLLLAHFSGLFRSSCRVAIPSKVPTFPLSLASSANSIRICLILSSRSLRKILDNVRSNFSLWGTPTYDRLLV